MGMGSLLALRVVNTAMRIMAARYPEELVRTIMQAAGAAAAEAR